MAPTAPPARIYPFPPPHLRPASKESFNRRVAANVRYLREHHDWSRARLAQLTGIGETTLESFEVRHGQRGLTLHNSWLLASALEVSMDLFTSDVLLAEALPRPAPVATPSPDLLRAPQIHDLLRVLAALPEEAVSLVVSTALELELLLRARRPCEA